jgi:hypothetical protein
MRSNPTAKVILTIGDYTLAWISSGLLTVQEKLKPY